MDFSEGSITFDAPKGEITKKLPVFYNPVMQFDRDLTVAVLKEFGGKSYCDALAGSGIRGMRASKEAGIQEVYLNDLNPKAVKLIEKNLKKNDITGKVSALEANLLLRSLEHGNLDIVDIDPFGPFIPFLDSALRAVNRRKGLLCLTATDTAPLCGVSAKTCMRRYDAKPLRVSFAKEIGLRILIAVCARAAAKYDFAVKPLLCYNHRHYFRLYLATDNGVDAADAMLGKVSYLQHCKACDWRGYVKISAFKEKCPDCEGKLDWAGPLWGAEFADASFCKKLKTDNKAVMKMLGIIETEQKIPTPFYDMHYLCELRKSPLVPRKRDIIASLPEATETHFADTGIRSRTMPSF